MRFSPQRSGSGFVSPPPVRRSLLALALLGVFACLGLGSHAWHTSPVLAQAIGTQPVITAQPAESVPPAVKGKIEPRRFVELGVFQPGRVETLLVKEGDQVEQGSVLLRLDSYEQYTSAVAAAELQLVLARQAVDELHRTAAVSLADATLALKQAEKARALAADKLASLQRSKDQSRIEQVKANLLLAEKRLADDREELAKAQRLYNKRRDIIWRFVSRHQFELLLTMMEKGVAYSERRYVDAKKKYEDLLKPLDEIDLSLARSNLALADARLHRTEQERLKWLHGPDPDQLATARARLKSAEAGLAAARSALQNAEIVSPISGTVVDLKVKQGESAIPGQALAVVADLSQWVLETKDLGEGDAVHLQPGERLSLSLDAYPQARLEGVVESVSQYYTEDEGDVFYHARVGLQPAGVPLLWGMTARIIP
jgi:multidrug efflux pump subunit AcrA (membrane-fusion protein)